MENMELQTRNVDKELLERLQRIEMTLASLKADMPSKEMFLDIEENQLLEESYEHERNETLISSKELRKQLLGQ